MKKKHIMLMTAFIMMFSMMMLSFGNVYAGDNTLPDGAPFTAIYIGAGSPLAVESEDKTLNGDNVTLYTITVPEGADNAVVFFPMDLGICDESYCVFGSSFVNGELSDDAVLLDAGTEDGENVMVQLPVDDYLSEDESWICPMKADDNTLVCAFTFEIHEHDWSGWQPVNDKQHKRVCSSEECSHFTETENHTWNEPEVITAAGEYSTGLSKYICSKCGTEKEVVTLPTSGKIKVSNAEELVNFANNAPVGVGILLTNDIDLTGVEWTGIPKFTGDFEGQGHTIKIPNGTNGLFVTVGGNSKTKRAKIEDVTIEGNISGKGCVGGIAGTAYFADFDNCFNKASVNASYGGNFIDQGVGGIVGKAEQSPTAASAVSFTNCGNNGTISGDAAVGGIYGYCKAGGVKVDSCYNKGVIQGKSKTVTSGGTGGIAGYSQGYRESSTFINVYNSGSISGNMGVGGLIGSMYNGTKITNGYNSGTITGNISGTVTDDPLTGAIAGSVYNTSAVAENCYYLDTSCDQAASGKTSENTGGISAVSKTSEELKDDSMIDLLGTSFDSSLGYPVLVWENYDPEGTTYSISAPNVEGVTFTGPKLASSEKPYSFKVTIDRYHKLTDDFAVKINDETVIPVSVSGDPLSPEGTTYSFKVEEPSCDMNISVEGVVSAKTQIYKYGSYPKPSEIDYISAIDVYNVEVTEIEADGSDINVILASDTPLDQKIPFTVSRGGMFRTIVTPGTAFDSQLVDGQLTANVTATSKAISTNPSYTWNINVNIGYSITKKPQDKVTINGKDQAVRGSDYTFTLEFDPRYSPSDNFVVKVDGNEVTPDDGGIYKIENVQGPHTITTSGDLNLVTFDKIIAVKNDSTEETVVEKPSNALLGLYNIKLGFFPSGTWGATYNDVPYYHIVVPKNTEKVKIVYPKGTYSSVHGQKHITGKDGQGKDIIEDLSDDDYWSTCKVKVENKVPQDCNSGNTWDVGYTAYTVDDDDNKVIELDISDYLINKDDEGTGFGFSAIGETGEGKLGLYGVISFEILQAECTKEPKANDLIYNGQAQDLVTEGTATGGEMQYALGTDDQTAPTDWNEDIPSKTDVGTYYVWYKVIGDDNHNSTEPAYVEVKINPVDKTNLNNAIAEAESYYDSIKNETIYADVASTLKTAIDTANDIAKNDNVVESVVADAITAINKAKTDAEAGKKSVDDAPAEKALADAKAAAETAKTAADKSAANENISEADRSAISKAKADVEAAVAAADKLPETATAADKNAAAKAIENAVKALDEAANTANANSEAAKNAKELESKKSNTIKNLTVYSESKALADASEAEKAVYDKAVADGKAAINAAKDSSEVEAALTKAKKAIDAAIEKIKQDRADELARIKSVKTVTVNVSVVNNKTIKAAIEKAGGSDEYVETIVLGKKVKKISKNAFKNYKKVNKLVIKTKKLKKSKIKTSLKGSKITKVQVKVGTKKVNKKYVKKYKKIFTKKNTGKKVKVTL